MIPQTLWSLSIFCWQDIAEIVMIFIGFLYISYWFKKDTKKPLLSWLYGYTLLFLITDYVHMTTLATALITFAPLTFIILILIHKETLQKNFIALHAIRTPKEHETYWPEELVQATLAASNKNIGMTCIIEKNDAMAGFTDKALESLNVPISKDILQLLTTSPLYKEDQLIVINQDGKIVSVNDSWKKNSIDLWLTKELQEQDEWIQDAIFFTTKTDAYMFKHDPISRTYTTIHKGKVVTHVTAQMLLHQFFSHVGLNTMPHKTKGVFYGTFSTESSSEQSLS